MYVIWKPFLSAFICRTLHFCSMSSLGALSDFLERGKFRAWWKNLICKKSCIFLNRPFWALILKLQKHNYIHSKADKINFRMRGYTSLYDAWDRRYQASKLNKKFKQGCFFPKFRENGWFHHYSFTKRKISLSPENHS